MEDPMIRLGSITAAPVLILLASATASTQEPQDTPATEVDCDSICLIFPAQAPAECACGIMIGTGSGGASSIDYDELTADDVLDLERSAYLDRMEGITDYWLVEHSNITPIPTVQYYERNPTGVWPPFRLVPPAEMQEHWIETDPNLTQEQRAVSKAVADDPAAMLAGMAGAIGLAGSMLAGELPVGGAELEGASAQVAAGLMEAALGMQEHMAEEERERADEFQNLIDETELLFTGSEVRKAVYAPGLPYGRGYHEEDAVRFQFYRPGSSEAWKWSLLGTTISFEVPCLVLSTNKPVEIQGDDGTYVIESAEKWVAVGSKEIKPTAGLEDVAAPNGEAKSGWAANTPGFVPVYLRMVVRRGLEQIVVSRESTAYAEMATQHQALIATVIRERIEGLSAALPEVSKKVEVGGVNEGMPSREQVIEKTGGHVGVPGADPTNGNPG
jgi:hypothetical protein